MAGMTVWLVCLAALAQQPATLYYAIPEPSKTSWTSYSVPLVESAGWTLGSPVGPIPNQAQFLDVLGSLHSLTIGLDTNLDVYLANVSLAGLAGDYFSNCDTAGWTLADNIATGCVSQQVEPLGDIQSRGAPAIFIAPAKYLGNRLAAYGGQLTFLMEESYVEGRGGYVTLTANIYPSNAAPTTMQAWGDDYSGQYDSTANLTNVIAVSGGRYFSLVLKADGTVTNSGWTLNSFPDGYVNGALSASLKNPPVGLSNVVSIGSGSYHFLALKSNGTVVGWGNNSYGQTNVPPGLSNVVAIAGGSYHGLALKSDGTVVAWGSTNYTVNNGKTNITSGPPNFGQWIVPASLSNVVAIAGGGFHSLALRADGTMTAWGRGNSGQTNIPPGLSNLVAIAAGTAHNLALNADGTVFAWGLNSSGQTNVPPGLSNVVAIAAGSFFSLALKADGSVVGWGDNIFLQTNMPPGLGNVAAIAAGGYHGLSLIGTGPPVTQVPLGISMVNPNEIAISLPTQSGRVYALEYKNALTDANWAALPLVAGTGRPLTFTDPAGLNTQRFYRVRRW